MYVRTDVLCSEKGTGFPGTGVSGSELFDECSEVNSDPLQKLHMCLTTEPSLLLHCSVLMIRKSERAPMECMAIGKMTG